MVYKWIFIQSFQLFRPGVEKIIQQTPVPVIPMAISGLWGSFFSRKAGKAMSAWPRKLWAIITLSVGEPVAPEQVTADSLYKLTNELRGDEK